MLIQIKLIILNLNYPTCNSPECPNNTKLKIKVKKNNLDNTLNELPLTTLLYLKSSANPNYSLYPISYTQLGVVISIYTYLTNVTRRARITWLARRHCARDQWPLRIADRRLRSHHVPKHFSRC